MGLETKDKKEKKGLFSIFVDNASDELKEKVVEEEYEARRRKHRVGGFLVFVGVIWAILGIGGTTTFISKITGLELSLVDASPGLVLVVLGVYLFRDRKTTVS